MTTPVSAFVPARESGHAVDVRAMARGSGQASREVAYRPDIDGLRAVAVLLVVLNHAGLAVTPGGFVGVDVFFVISGFLITALIRAQQAEGSFRFSDFYTRRAKRLLPALFAVILAVLGAGWWLLTPGDYALLAQSALSALGLGSNVFFWANTGGYFSPDADSMPLLHVWSLSLEEQFYLLWPAALLLVLQVRAAHLRIAVVAVAILASVLFAAHGVRMQSSAAYFLLPARAGEFLIGALAWFLWADRRPSRLLANALSGVGLVLVLGSAALLTATSPFPGMAALAPCLGAAMIIAAPQFGPSAVTTLLASAPLVFVGLISYSVYLWHWPIVCFLRLSQVSITPWTTAGIVAGSLLLGAASWRLLERDYRALLDGDRRWALGTAAVLLSAVLAAPVVVLVGHGFPQRFPFALLTQDELTAERRRYWVELPAKKANLGEGTGKKLLIVGDSHAFDLAYALAENGYPGKIKLIETRHECFNFGGEAVLPKDAAYCAGRLDIVLQSEALRQADAVYLHDHWGGEDEANLVEVVNRLRAVTKAPIYVFGPKMTFTDNALAIAQRAQSSRHVTASAINAYAATYQRPGRAVLDRRLAAAFQARPMADVHYVSLLDAQCGAALDCKVLSPAGKMLYFDSGHLTLEGSRLLGTQLKRRRPDLF